MVSHHRHLSNCHNVLTVSSVARIDNASRGLHMKVRQTHYMSVPSLFVAPRAKSGWWLACAWCFYNLLRCSEGARRLCTDAQTDLPGLRCISRGSSSSKWRMCHPISLIIIFERWRVKMYCICFKDTILPPLPAIQSGYPS
jgi:hypothetical protein